MSNIVSMSVTPPRSVSMNPVQRSIYFALGFGSIVVGLVTAPTSVLLFAAVNLLGIALVTSAIIGRAVRFSRLKVKGRKVGSIIQPTTSASLAVGIATAAIVIPGIPAAWLAVIHTAAVLLALSALLNMEFAMTDRKHSTVESLTIEKDDDWSYADAA